MSNARARPATRRKRPIKKRHHAAPGEANPRDRVARLAPSEGAVATNVSPAYARIRQIVAKIPRGRVMTYGDVALAAGMPRAARVVGYAMHALGETVPWQRVIGRRSARAGQLTIADPQSRARQRRLLEAEGVTFSASGAIELLVFGWSPKRAPRPGWRRAAEGTMLA